MQFTVKQIEKVVRSGKSQILTEDAPKGTGKLALRVRQYSAEWLFQYYIKGKRKMFKLGNAHGAGCVNLADARSKAEALREMVVNKLDPKVEFEKQEAVEESKRREYEAQGSVEQLFQAYLDDLNRRGKRTCERIENTLLTGKYAAADALGRSTKAADVSSAQLVNFLESIYRRGSKSSAVHTRTYLHSAFQFGLKVEHDYTRRSAVRFGLTVNPVAAVAVDSESKVVGNRVLSDDDIRAIFIEMGLPGSNVSGPLANALRLIVSIGGARVREVVEARIDEFELDNKVWNLPAERTKNGLSHSLPLSERALKIVEDQLTDNESEFLFPAKDGQPIRFHSLRQAVSRFNKKHDREHWSPRDLRRTTRTKLADAGEPDHRLDLFLNHGRSGVGQKHYDRSLHLKSKTKTMIVLDKVLSRILGDGETKIIPLRRNGTGE